MSRDGDGGDDDNGNDGSPYVYNHQFPLYYSNNWL